MYEDKELQEYRDLLEAPDHFEEGFDWKTVVGAIFIGFLMMPGSMYLQLVIGTGIGPAARWVTIILFAEMAKRSYSELKQQEIFLLYYMAGAALATPFQGLLWSQYLVQSDAARMLGLTEFIPTWVAPGMESSSLVERTFFHRDWLIPILLLIGTQIIQRIDQFGLGYALYRITSDVEKLPFPMAPVAALGTMALAESTEDKKKSWKWRIFSIGGIIGLVFGGIYVLLPTLSGLIFTQPIRLIPIPWIELTPHTEDLLPAVATGIQLDLGLVFIGMVLPFWAVIGGLVGLIITIIARNHKMVAINFARTMDLSGQVYADALPHNHFSGVTGMFDFIQGTSMSPGGKSIIVIPARSIDGKTSRIIQKADRVSPVIPKAFVSYVVSEFGMVNLLGKNAEERAMGMISLAHPDFRDELFQKAKEDGLIDRDRSLNDALFGIYPVRMEETRVYDGQRVIFRPAKPVDARLIQEHFYNMDEEDVQTRFFSMRRNFYREDMDKMAQVDYIKNLVIVAATGEIGFEKIIGLGVYAHENSAVAEVAFSTSKDWQGKGIGSILLRKLAEAARENGFLSLVAEVLPTNTAMIKLFKKLPYQINTKTEYGSLILSCNLDEET